MDAKEISMEGNTMKRKAAPRMRMIIDINAMSLDVLSCLAFVFLNASQRRGAEASMQPK